MEAQQQGRGGNRVAKRGEVANILKTFGAKEVLLEDSIWQDQLILYIDCFHSSGKLQQAQLPKSVENFDTTTKFLDKTFISTQLPIVSQ